MNDRLLVNDVLIAPAHSLPEQLIKKVTWIGVAVNIVLAVCKLFAGIYGDSQAVVADGVEALLDVFTVIIVYAASRFWMRPPDDTHPFGHGRMETLVAVLHRRLPGGRCGRHRLGGRWRPCTKSTWPRRDGLRSSPHSRPLSARKSSTAGRPRSAAG